MTIKATGLGCLFAILFALPAYPDDEAKQAPEKSMVTVSAASIKVGRIVDESTGGNEYLTMGFAPGTQIHLLLKANKGKIIEQDWSFDDDTMTDSLGNNLMPELPAKPNRPVQGPMHFQPHRGGELATLQFYGTQLPAKGATSISLKCNLTFYHAYTTKFHQQTVTLKPGTEINAGPIQCVVERTDVRAGKKGPLRSVTLAFPDTMPQLAEIEFYREKGGKLKKYLGHHSVHRDEAGDLRKTLTFLIETNEERATVRFEAWSDLDQITLPLDLKIGLDLAAEADF